MRPIDIDYRGLTRREFCLKFYEKLGFPPEEKVEECRMVMIKFGMTPENVADWFKKPMTEIDAAALCAINRMSVKEFDRAVEGMRRKWWQERSNN